MAFSNDVVGAPGICNAVENSVNASASFRLLHARLSGRFCTKGRLPTFLGLVPGHSETTSNNLPLSAFSEIGIKASTVMKTHKNKVSIRRFV